MDPVIIVEGTELEDFREHLNRAKFGPGLSKLSVYVDGEQVNFKINEYMWSHPIGRKRKDG